jgi:hypothetical protein
MGVDVAMLISSSHQPICIPIDSINSSQYIDRPIPKPVFIRDNTSPNGVEGSLPVNNLRSPDIKQYWGSYRVNWKR